jgi:ABC-type transport system involved in multi-copper enzyme maturation permease subunit
MTSTMTPYRSQAQPGRDGFLELLGAEWTKFSTVRGWWVGMACAALAVVLVGLLGTAASPQHGAANGPGIPTGPSGEPVNDSFFFVHRTLTGNGSITVPVTSLTGVIDGPSGGYSGTQPWAKAGVIMKESLSQGSPYAAVMVTPGHGVRMQYDYTQDIAGLPGPVTTGAPRWLRLVRSGATITGYESANGTSWTPIGSARLPGLAGTVQAGLFVTSPSVIQDTNKGGGTVPAVATAVFGRPGLLGQWSQQAWTGQQLGGAGTSGSYTNTITTGRFAPSGTGFTVTGAGDIAPVVGGIAMGPGYTLENFLVGAFAGLIVMIVIATLFITGEYRRRLIRTTLTVTPRRGRVLLAKALIIGSVTFAAGLAGAAAAVLLGEPHARANGFLTFAVRPLTELRVLAGTGLLLAVTAVLALALGVILRRSAPVIAIVVAVTVLPYILGTAGVLPAGPAEWLLRVTPAAGFAILQSVPRYEQVMNIYTPPSGYYPLAPWAGLAVLCGYAILALAAATILLRRRDA